jgi:hypothetical protein
MQSTYDPAVNGTLTDGTEAWILVDIRSALSQFNLNRENSPKTLSCDGWKMTDTGATVTAKGEFKTATCENSHHVACCGLKSP